VLSYIAPASGRRRSTSGDNHSPQSGYFAKAALGQGTFPITPEGILQTAAALEAVFNRWMPMERGWRCDCGVSRSRVRDRSDMIE